MLLRLAFFTLLVISLTNCEHQHMHQSQQEVNFICPPCDLPCDTLFFSEAGICPHCKMELINKSDLIDESNLTINDIHIKTGRGIFLESKNKIDSSQIIKVYTYKPKNFNPNNRILLVIPGAGRDGIDYLNSWIDIADEKGVLILSLEYDELYYPFEDYHLGGVVNASNMMNIIEEDRNSNEVYLNEDKLVLDYDLSKNNWLFNDFDRIFDKVVSTLNSDQKVYDIFGHSAGGQILHRMALLQAHGKANHIISANSGFYTFPDKDKAYPFGLNFDRTLDHKLADAFNKKLTLLIGANDNEKETGGIILRSRSADEQGRHRLERGQNMFMFSKNIANKKDFKFNWKLEIVPNTGHNQKLMARAASKILYE